MLGLGVEGGLQEAQRRRRQRQDLIGVATHLGAQLSRRYDAVDEAPALGRSRVVAAAQEPDLAGALLTHHARQVAGAEACVEGAPTWGRLAEPGAVGGDGGRRVGKEWR